MPQHSHQTAPTQFVDSAGIRFAYRRFGKSGGVPLVFNTHFTGTMDHWDPLVTDGLAAGREANPDELWLGVEDRDSLILQQNLPNAQLILYPDSHHGSQYQYPMLFVADVTRFLDAAVPFPIQKETDHG
jgi:pimeloyl-ACP methyl ester carboxylesterase